MSMLAWRPPRARALELAGAVAFALFAGWRFLDPRRLIAGFEFL